MSAVNTPSLSSIDVAEEGPAMVDAIRELTAVLREWRRGEGELAGLLRAWLEVVLGRVVVDELKYSTRG